MPELNHIDFLKLDLELYKWIHFEVDYYFIVTFIFKIIIVLADSPGFTQEVKLDNRHFIVNIRLIKSTQ